MRATTITTSAMITAVKVENTSIYEFAENIVPEKETSQKPH